MSKPINIIINTKELFSFDGNDIYNVDITPGEFDELVKKTVEAAVGKAKGAARGGKKSPAAVHKPTNTKRVSIPSHEDFYTTTAIFVWNAAIAQGATTEGALLLVTQAGNESGYSSTTRGPAVTYKDFNLFGKMTKYKAEASKRPIDNGNLYVKKYASYEDCIKDHFKGFTPQGHWPLFSDIVKKDSFTFSDIDDALNTGACTPSKQERNSGVYPYNSDLDVNGSGFTDGKNHYGEILLEKNYPGVKKGFITALQYQIAQNNSLIEQLSYYETLLVITPEGQKEYEKRADTLAKDNQRYQKIIDAINAAKM